MSNLIKPILTDSEVHLWFAHLDSQFPQYEYYKTLLSAQEKERESKFIFDYLRKRFTIGRGLLRIILQKYISDNNIEFSYTAYGKPYLTNHHSNLQFNVSHSNDIAIFSVTKNSTIGVDIEKLQTKFFDDGMLALVFSRRERAIFDQLNSSSKITSFFNTWTRKEAFLKAIGLGLNISLPDIEIIDETKIIWTQGNNREQYNWRLFPISYPNYVGAVVVEGKSICTCFNF